MICYFVLLLMTMIGAIASLFLKKASGASGVRMLLTNGNLYIGGCLYVLGILLNIYVLRYLDYTVVLPMTSFTYVWTMVVSYWALNEKITKKKLLGVCLIVVGAVFVANG